VPVVEEADVSSTYVLHHGCDTAAYFGRNEKVHVIWHKDIGMDRALVPSGCIAHASEVQPSIRVVEKT